MKLVFHTFYESKDSFNSMLCFSYNGCLIFYSVCSFLGNRVVTTSRLLNHTRVPHGRENYHLSWSNIQAQNPTVMTALVITYWLLARLSSPWAFCNRSHGNGLNGWLKVTQMSQVWLPCRHKAHILSWLLARLSAWLVPQKWQ